MKALADDIVLQRSRVVRVRRLEARVAACLGTAAVHAAAAVEEGDGYVEMLEQLLRLLPPPPRVKFACSVMFGDQVLPQTSSSLPAIIPNGTIVSPPSFAASAFIQLVMPMLPQAHAYARAYASSASSAAQVTARCFRKLYPTFTTTFIVICITDNTVVAHGTCYCM